MMKGYFKSRYSDAPILAFGFHGCRQSVADKVLCDHEDLRDSINDYDWLGRGKYFWEANPDRAYEWASLRYGEQDDGPAVIGACIDLTRCLNLIDTEALNRLSSAYIAFKFLAELAGRKMPTNGNASKNGDKLLRKLDCAVVNFLCGIHATVHGESVSVVRGVFWEGKELYRDAGFKEKNHIQLCVRDPKSILCYFHPRCF